MENNEATDIYGLEQIKKAKDRKKKSKASSILKDELFYEFCLSPRKFSGKVLARLKKRILRLQFSDHEQEIQLKFSSVVSMLKNEVDEIGFKIQISQYHYYELYCHDREVVGKWKTALGKLVVFWGFYDDFKPITKIGEGKSASVFLAKRRKDGEKVAIKTFLKSQLKADIKSMAALQNEIEILKSLHSRYIVKIFEVYETEKSYYLITEYIEGRTLKTYLEGSASTYSECKKILKQIATGLAYLAQKNVAHRDIKPENIIMSIKYNHPVIVDFGLATNCGLKSYIYEHCGTPGYVAPEIFKDSHQITPAVDIFSLGIIFHLLVFRKFPYTSNNFNDILQQNRLASFNFNLIEYALLPRDARQLLESMLIADPNLRISASKICKKLELKMAYQKENPESAMTVISNKRNQFSKVKKGKMKFLRSGSLDFILRRRVNRVF